MKKPAKGRGRANNAANSYEKARRALVKLRARLSEAEATLDAIRTGRVDALVVQGPSGDQVFTLKGADHRYRQLVESMNEGAVLLAANGVIVYANARFAGMVKQPLESMIGSQLHTFVADPHHRVLEALFAEAARPGRKSHAGGAKAELELRASEGELVPVYLSVAASWDQEDALTCVIATDLTEQKRYQEIVASERLASLIVEQAAEGIVVCDVNGQVVRASPAADRLARSNTLLRRFDEAFVLADETGRDDVARLLVTTALGGQTISGKEATCMRGQEARVLLLSAGPILSGGREPLGCLISFVDITERKHATEERQILLERANAARVAAESGNRAKDEFLAMLGHELRNPLAPILTALQLMRLRAPEARREREVIERQVKHVVTLVDDLLDVSRITRGKIEIDRKVVGVDGIVTKAIEQASPLIEGRQHHLDVEMAPELWINADEFRMAQVLANLLNNAAKYTEQGGRILVRAVQEGSQVVISVRDNGVGISSDILPNLFNIFVQGRRTLDRSEGGLGLGLAIVRSLVALHDGTVAARSAGTGSGSEFEIRLPAAQAPPLAIVDGPAAARSAVERKRVLIVDDNVDAADLLAETLDVLGHETRVAYDGPSALGLAESFAPDVALLDIGLPVMDGFELAGKLRHLLAARQPLRLIALTGYGQASDRLRSERAGFDDHLIKPVEMDVLTRALRGGHP
jgi:PAS domain S-box-containing protein